MTKERPVIAQALTTTTVNRQPQQTELEDIDALVRKIETTPKIKSPDTSKIKLPKAKLKHQVDKVQQHEIQKRSTPECYSFDYFVETFDYSPHRENSTLQRFVHEFNQRYINSQQPE